MNDEDRALLAEQSRPLSCGHGGYLFGCDFEPVEHLADFCGALHSIDALLAELKGLTDWSSAQSGAEMLVRS
jgi:hypothetical protein